MECVENFRKNKIVRKKPSVRLPSRTILFAYLSQQHILETSSHSMKETIEKAKAGSQIAFSNLLDTYWNEVYGFQLGRTKNENDAEDITIQTFSRAFDKIQSYDDAYEFKTWLFTISKNLHVDLIRKRKEKCPRTQFTERSGGH